MRTVFTALIMLVSCISVKSQQENSENQKINGINTISVPTVTLEKEFLIPPVCARPKALWPWVRGNFSLSQITYELEEARQKGMGGFDIWDVGSDMNPDGIIPDGPAFLSDESVSAIAHTIREADRLGLEIGLITSSSWNAGGAWVKPEHGAMGLFRTDTVLTGPVTFKGSIPLPAYPAGFES